MNKAFDYIIVGAGCAGLSLLVRLIDEPALASKKILLIDRQPKAQNDRTWCFWEQGESYFQSIVHHEWEQLWVKHDRGNIPLDLSGYKYKLIRGIDFYKYCFTKINNAPNVEVVYGEVTEINHQTGMLMVGDDQYQAEHIFSSVLRQPPVLRQKDIYLLQHFKGWWIETPTDFFDPTAADLMNFRTTQAHGCAFVYMLPVSKRRALIEFTLFSEDVLTEEQYNDGLNQFITHELRLNSYQIAETEQGVIPMTTFKFDKQHNHVTYIGTAGGQTKASTGYTFQFIQTHSADIVKNLVQKSSLLQAGVSPARFSFYDHVLLRVLKDRIHPGADVFFDIFRKNKADSVLSFLDNESNIWQELGIMYATPQVKFIKAAIKQYT